MTDKTVVRHFAVMFHPYGRQHAAGGGGGGHSTGEGATITSRMKESKLSRNQWVVASVCSHNSLNTSDVLIAPPSQNAGGVLSGRATLK